MQRVNDWWFYNLGWQVHSLTEIKEGQSIADHAIRFYLAHSALDQFLDGSEIFPFKVSWEAAQQLRTYIQAFIDEPYDNERVVNFMEAGEIGRLVTRYETIAAAEVTQFSTYSVLKKMAYDTRTLLDEGESLLPLDIRNKVPQECLEDLKEAAKCMAFEVNTAAGFHTVRATEAVIRKYYEAVVGSLPRTKDRNWGAYIRVLKSRGADARVTGFLDHIRESYRNPISHPEQKLDSQDAQVLLGVCLSAIIQMVRALDALANATSPYHQLVALASGGGTINP